MDTFDLILLITGVLLILVGLGLFIFGNRDGNKNYLEGFGIKLDVSNPSIILIVAGVGLLLAPRLLPANKPAMGETSEPLQKVRTITPRDPQQASATPTSSSQEESNSSTSRPQQQEKYFMPQGQWQLNDYQESGVPLPNVQGTIRFSPNSGNKTDWQADFIFMDMWGNRSGYSYQGKMWHDASGQYFISLTASNDPGFTPQAQAPLELMMEQSTLLHMKYHYRGVEILLHLVR